MIHACIFMSDTLTGHVSISYSETYDERDPPTRDQPATGDPLLMAVVLFDVVKYTSDERLPRVKDHFMMAFRVVSHRRFHCTLILTLSSAMHTFILVWINSYIITN